MLTLIGLGFLRVVFSEGRGGVSVTEKVLKSTERLDKFQLNFQERCDLDNINSHNISLEDIFLERPQTGGRVQIDPLPLPHPFQN